jgi:hypothetical protein
MFCEDQSRSCESSVIPNARVWLPEFRLYSVEEERKLGHAATTYFLRSSRNEGEFVLITSYNMTMKPCKNVDPVAQSV